ncbi:MAG TPA: hypothetical protein VFY23_07755 [Candidatus Limnocylindrales bacterium]|nr:hypothetical protein [Candidatus Limnocylindrales bacterium]
MAPVTVVILAPARDPGAAPLARVLEDARAWLADELTTALRGLPRPPGLVLRRDTGGRPFGAWLREMAAETTREAAGGAPGGLVVLGAGSVPLARREDLDAFLGAAAADEPGALANTFYSADIVAVAQAARTLADVPADLAADNALPRWLAEVAGVPIRDLRGRRHLAVDVDSPLDLVLLEDARPGIPVPGPEDSGPVRTRLDALRALARDPAAELLLAGRTSAADLARVERGSRARTRALIEERGLRTAQLGEALGRPNRRPPRSLLGELLVRDGPGRLGALVADLADGALIDTRVLIAARAGTDERAWPTPEDRFASDLLLPDRVRDPWLRALTEGVADAPVPIVLGAHTLVGPGAPLALGLDGATG